MSNEAVTPKEITSSFCADCGVNEKYHKATDHQFLPKEADTAKFTCPGCSADPCKCDAAREVPDVQPCEPQILI